MSKGRKAWVGGAGMRSKALVCVAVATIALSCLACGGCRKSDSAAGPAPGPNTAQPQPAPPTAPAQPPQPPPKVATAEPVALVAAGGVIHIGPFVPKFVDECYSWSYSDSLQVVGNLVSLTERRVVPLPVADGVVGSQDGKRAAFFDSGYLRVRDLQSGEESSWPLGHPQDIRYLCDLSGAVLSFSPSGRYLLASVGVDKAKLARYTVFGIDFETGRHIRLSTEETHLLWGPVWSPDGAQVVVREYLNPWTDYSDMRYLLFDLAAGQSRPLHDVHESGPFLELQHSVRWVGGQAEIMDLPREAEGPNGELAFGYDPVGNVDQETGWEDFEGTSTLRIRSGQSVFDLDLLPALAEAGLGVPPPSGTRPESHLGFSATWVRATNRILVFVQYREKAAYVLIDPADGEPRCLAARAGLDFTPWSDFHDEISPDGTQAAVVRVAGSHGAGEPDEPPEGPGVYLLNLITAEERLVLEEEALEAWFLDDGRLVVITPTEAAVTSAGGEDWSVLMAAPAGDLYTTSSWPSELSPDGRYLALARSHELDDGWDQITVDVVDLSQ